MDRVYFIRCGEFVKVGLAADVKRRVQELQVGVPFDLALIGSVQSEHAALLERALHVLFADHKVRGEWFHFAPVADRIDGLLTGRESPLQTIARARALKRLDDRRAEGRKKAKRRQAEKQTERLTRRRVLADAAQDRVDAHLRRER